jgi:Rha family phage regulatory protein
MKNLLAVSDGKIRVDSKVIADSFGKIHRDVLRAIDGLECSEEFRVRNFAQSSYTSSQGKVLPCVSMTRDGFCMVAMGFTGKRAAQWKESFLDAFNRMEDALSSTGAGAMKALSDAVHALECDMEKASKYGKALSEWKRIKQGHIEAIIEANSKTQMLLSF